MLYYIDESGNTGDLGLASPDLEFGGKSTFVLAAVGSADEVLVTLVLDELRKKYNIKSRELKLSQIYKKKPGLILDVVNHITSTGAPYFVEVVDKKYQLAVNMTDNFVWPPYFNLPVSNETAAIKSTFADFIYDYLPNYIFSSFLQLLKFPSNSNVAKFFNLLMYEALSQSHQKASQLHRCLAESKDDYEKIIDLEGENAYKRFLPLPDEGKRGQVVRVLPHFACFTNLYARINRYHGGDLTSCRIIHDEQSHFDEIIRKAKRQVEEFDIDSIEYTPPYADYDFHETADLCFKASHAEAGIQFADIVAGLVMRYYTAKLNDEPISNHVKDSMYKLLSHSDSSKSVGINLVTSNAMLDAFVHP